VALAANWRFALDSVNADFTPGVNLWSVTGVTQAGVKDITLAVPRPLIMFTIFFIVAEALYAGETGSTRGIVTNVRLWGEEGALSRATETPSVIHIAENVVDQIQAGTPISDEKELVQESLFLRDTFTDANGVLLPAHVPDIDKDQSAWVNAWGVFDIQGNEANVSVLGAGNIAIAVKDRGLRRHSGQRFALDPRSSTHGGLSYLPLCRHK